MHFYHGTLMYLHPVYPQKGFSPLCLVRKGGWGMVVYSSLTVELTVWLLILSTDLRSNSYLAVSKAGCFILMVIM